MDGPLRFQPSIVAEKNVTKYILDGRTDDGRKDGRMTDGRTDGWTDGRTEVKQYTPSGGAGV
jgi:hypothetical protein